MSRPIFKHLDYCAFGNSYSFSLTVCSSQMQSALRSCRCTAQRSRPLLTRSMAIKASETTGHGHTIKSRLSQISHAPQKLQKLRDIFAASPSPTIKSVISSSVLQSLEYSPKNQQSIQLALQNLNPENVSDETIQIIITIVGSIKDPSQLDSPFEKSLINFFTTLVHHNPSIIEFLQDSIPFEGSHIFINNILTLLYIHTNQLTSAVQFIERITASSKRVYSSTIELLLIHLSNHGELTKAAIILRLAHDENYKIYPRTHSEFLSKAIQFGNVHVCAKNYQHVLSKTYIDNGSLVALAELLVRRISAREMASLCSIASSKASMTPDLNARLRRAVVENFSWTKGVNVGLQFLSMTHLKGGLRCEDYPVMQSYFKVSERGDRATRTLFEGLKRKDFPGPVKKFYLAMTVAKLVEQDRLSTALTILKSNSMFLSMLNADAVWQLVKGLRVTNTQTDFDSFVDILVRSETVIRERRVIDPLVKSLVNSEYWFLTFKILSQLQNEHYRFDTETAEALAAHCRDIGQESRLADIQEQWFPRSE
ncbi:CYFA0S01e12420g1_1 [Cyberlindnera fabianii]|uniref:CYFA0S01e12420g1_1 n=1 Tax=Cyberlindnera fabianii TaxID=36022 RepID=A0A061AQF0_CYBFA|nr:CYFA0S01e12420g1_1 [Cyberlindnera fabianii]